MSEHVMDRATTRLREIHTVSGWLLRHWLDFSQDLYHRESQIDIPFDLRLEVLEILQADLANLLTIAQHWRLFKDAHEQQPD